MTLLKLVLPFGLAGLLLLLAGCGSSNPATSEPALGAFEAPDPGPHPVPVITAEPATVFTHEVTAPAKLEVNQNRISRVLLPVSGRIVEVLAKLGDAVRPGQPLLALESHDADVAESAYQQATASLTQARAALAKAETDQRRASELFAQQAIPRKELREAEHQVVSAANSVQIANAVLDQADRKLHLLGLKPGAYGQQILVRAPIAGKIVALGVVAGEVHNDLNRPLITIADLSTLWVTTNVPETHIRFCRPGGDLKVDLLAFPGEAFTGRVAQIADTVDPQLRTVKVRAELANPTGRFLPEMYGQVRYLEGPQPAVSVPQDAILQAGDKAYVLVEQQPGSFVRREVSPGRREGERRIILQGLAAGDRVAAEAGHPSLTEPAH